jgi:hypothetical protein
MIRTHTQALHPTVRIVFALHSANASLNQATNEVCLLGPLETTFSKPNFQDNPSKTLVHIHRPALSGTPLRVRGSVPVMLSRCSFVSDPLMLAASCIDQELSGLMAQAPKAAPRNLRRSTARLSTDSGDVRFITFLLVSKIASRHCDPRK